MHARPRPHATQDYAGRGQRRGRRAAPEQVRPLLAGGFVEYVQQLDIGVGPAGGNYLAGLLASPDGGRAMTLLSGLVDLAITYEEAQARGVVLTGLRNQTQASQARADAEYRRNMARIGGYEGGSDDGYFWDHELHGSQDNHDHDGEI